MLHQMRFSPLTCFVNPSCPASLRTKLLVLGTNEQAKAQLKAWFLRALLSLFRKCLVQQLKSLLTATTSSLRHKTLSGLSMPALKAVLAGLVYPQLPMWHLAEKKLKFLLHLLELRRQLIAQLLLLPKLMLAARKAPKLPDKMVAQTLTAFKLHLRLELPAQFHKLQKEYLRLYLPLRLLFSLLLNLLYKKDKRKTQKP